MCIRDSVISGRYSPHRCLSERRSSGTFLDSSRTEPRLRIPTVGQNPAENTVAEDHPPGSGAIRGLGRRAQDQGRGAADSLSKGPDVSGPREAAAELKGEHPVQPASGPLQCLSTLRSYDSEVRHPAWPVSYTHLTLPTICSV